MIEEIVEMEKEEKIIYHSMFWSYMLLTKQVTLDEIFEKNEDFGLIFNPNDINEDLKVGGGQSAKFNPIEIINVLIEYFVDYEEYEKCEDLVNAKKYYKKKKGKFVWRD